MFGATKVSRADNWGGWHQADGGAHVGHGQQHEAGHVDDGDEYGEPHDGDHRPVDCIARRGLAGVAFNNK